MATTLNIIYGSESVVLTGSGVKLQKYNQSVAQYDGGIVQDEIEVILNGTKQENSDKVRAIRKAFLQADQYVRWQL